MDHLDVLNEAARTISSPRRFVRSHYITSRGACSIGHVVVAVNGGVDGVIGDKVAMHRSASDPLVREACAYIAKAILSIEKGETVTEVDPELVNRIVTKFNDTKPHAKVLVAFKVACILAERDRERENVPTLDYAEVDSLLAEAAAQEEVRELIAA